MHRARKHRGVASVHSLFYYDKFSAQDLKAERQTVKPFCVHCSVHEILECVCEYEGEKKLRCWNNDPVKKSGDQPLPFSGLRSCFEGILDGLLSEQV